MNTFELAAAGIALASELDILATRYHVKSEDHDILSWEADILRAKSTDAVDDCGLSENLKESVLLSDWGARLASQIPAFAARVRDFDEKYVRVQSDRRP